MRRVTLVPVVLALVLGILWSGSVAARSPSLARLQPRVALRMSDAPDGPERLNFLPETTQVYIVVSYTNASETEYRIEVLDDSGGVVFRAEKTYSGTGEDPIPLTGDDIFQAYQDRVTENGTAMADAVDQAQIDLAEEDRMEALSHVTTAKLAASAMEAAIGQLRNPGYAIPPDADSYFQQALGALAVVKSEADAAVAALNQSPPDFDEARTRVDTMDAQAAQAVGSATQGVEALGDGGGKPFLETRACAPNTTKIVDVATGSPADSRSWSVGTPGPAAYMFTGPEDMHDPQKTGEIAASPSTIYASTVAAPGAVHSANVQAMVTDDHCIPVTNDTQISFSTNGGSVSPETAGTANGVVTATLTAGAQAGTVTVSATSGAASGSVPVTIIGPPNSVWVRTSHKYIGLGGKRVTVEAEVLDQNRKPVADGTDVAFHLEPTDLGSWSSPNATTVNGRATTELISGSTKGEAEVRATADGASDTEAVRFVGPVHSITITADPSGVFVFGPAAFTEIEVQAQDEDGNPAPDGTMVAFSLQPPDLGTFTDKSVALDDGRATTRLDAIGTMGLATITVEAGAVSDHIQVRFHGFEVCLPLLFRNGP